MRRVQNTALVLNGRGRIYCVQTVFTYRLITAFNGIKQNDKK
jgi:hypothetical protein